LPPPGWACKQDAGWRVFLDGLPGRLTAARVWGRGEPDAPQGHRASSRLRRPGSVFFQSAERLSLPSSFDAAEVGGGGVGLSLPPPLLQRHRRPDASTIARRGARRSFGGYNRRKSRIAPDEQCSAEPGDLYLVAAIVRMVRKATWGPDRCEAQQHDPEREQSEHQGRKLRRRREAVGEQPNTGKGRPRLPWASPAWSPQRQHCRRLAAPGREEHCQR
jgi:hypothetical protein